jgi:hypothetical protein
MADRMRSPLSPRVQDDATRRPSMEAKAKTSALNDAMKSWKGPVQFVEELPCRCVRVCVCVGEAKHVLLSPPRSELRAGRSPHAPLPWVQWARVIRNTIGAYVNSYIAPSMPMSVQVRERGCVDGSVCD